MVSSIGPINEIINKYGSAKVREALNKAAREAAKTAVKAAEVSRTTMPRAGMTGQAVLNVAREVAHEAFVFLNKGKDTFDDKEIAHIEKFARLIADQAIREVKSKEA